MICRYCDKNIPDDSLFCCYCGRNLNKIHSKKKRGNGAGSVYKCGDKWRAIVTIGYDGKKRITRSKMFRNRSEAISGLLELKSEPAPKPVYKRITFKEMYDKWIPTHNAGKSTKENYSAAFKYFEPVWDTDMNELDFESLQECIDECPKGKRTKQNMKAAAGLVYKYAIPRKLIQDNTNLATYLQINDDGKPAERESFSDEQILAIKNQIGRKYGAEYVYAMIYLGFRPSEFLALTTSSYHGDYLSGGSKTTAGKNRIVTISPKIKNYMSEIYERSLSLIGEKDTQSRNESNGNERHLIVDERSKPYTSLKDFTERCFYPVLSCSGIDNPIVDGRHKYTPHTCRHTFSTLMKRIKAPDKDKLSLIGHTSTEMLRYYQDVNLDDLKKITDVL